MPGAFQTGYFGYVVNVDGLALVEYVQSAKLVRVIPSYIQHNRIHIIGV